MLAPRLDKELAELRARFKLEVVEESDTINVIIGAFPTSSLYNLPTTDLLLRVPRAFPDAALDMFWTVPELTLASGAVAQASDAIEQYSGRSWRRFSWHASGWTSQSLLAYLDFVRTRFNAP